MISKLILSFRNVFDKWERKREGERQSEREIEREGGRESESERGRKEEKEMERDGEKVFFFYSRPTTPEAGGGAGGLAQLWVECVPPDKKILGSILAVVVRSLQVGSVSI